VKELKQWGTSTYTLRSKVNRNYQTIKI